MIEVRLVEGGHGEESEGDDTVVKSLIAVRPYEWPEDPETLVRDELAGSFAHRHPNQA